LPEPGNKLLVIDDQPDLCEFISEAAAGLGFESLAVTEPDAFRRAVQEHPESVAALNNLAHVLSERGKLDEALVLAERAVKLGGPLLPSAQGTLNDIRRKSGVVVQ